MVAKILFEKQILSLNLKKSKNLNGFLFQPNLEGGWTKGSTIFFVSQFWPTDAKGYFWLTDILDKAVNPITRTLVKRKIITISAELVFPWQKCSWKITETNNMTSDVPLGSVYSFR